jgi:hypothetical protein
MKPNPSAVLDGLDKFARQRPGLEFANYGDGPAYRAEARSIGRALTAYKREREALADITGGNLESAAALVLEAAPRAFSGRLEWTGKGWTYCTGQYFPTEYRAAARAVVAEAVHLARLRRAPSVPPPPEYRSVSAMKFDNEQAGGCFFDRSNMRFFRSRIEGGFYAGRFFITSEQREGEARAYTLRRYDWDAHSVKSVSEFQEFPTLARAREAARAAVATGGR